MNTENCQYYIEHGFHYLSRRCIYIDGLYGRIEPFIFRAPAKGAIVTPGEVAFRRLYKFTVDLNNVMLYSEPDVSAAIQRS